MTSMQLTKKYLGIYFRALIIVMAVKYLVIVPIGLGLYLLFQ